ncbi:hypothetical protein A3195_06385 [Candidatus Thiodiazotropha endoloripes]|uniref:hypothetical protein n=1 Tax=Candidatus Thiodiazotropha endoloripes TaxID=1818881 RepID=UPI00083CB3AF|nr:hypothetical protein [Candidatus Thiodiazotropha endoloripes]ODB84585.1 hypothetical protein A3193_17525 [Candidatus Thiodiazotropha endoloripes]ODB91049.1 hypothetical protein A3195_06385 [Candidatus Thiodiazotropha endoloripes]
MNSRTLLSIGLKLFGIYFLVSGISAITQIVWIFDSNSREGFQTTQILAISWHLAFLVFVGLLFTFKSELVAYVLDSSESKEISKSDISINNILRLIGVFLIATSIGSFLKSVIPLFPSEIELMFDFGDFLSTLASLIIGATLIFSPRVLNDLFKNKT